MQNIKKYFMTLALLLTAVGGAWAQTAFKAVEFEVPADWKTDNTPLTAADLPGFKAVTEKEAEAWTGAPSKGAALLFYAFDGENASYVFFIEGSSTSNATIPYKKNEVFNNSTSEKFYYTVEPTEWDLTSQDGKTWTLAKMPASNIELQVEYFAESNLFLGKEALADMANIAVKNGEATVEFDKDGKSTATVTEGNTVTAKFTGKKVLGMKVEKKGLAKTFNCDGYILIYEDGDTWTKVVEKNSDKIHFWNEWIENVDCTGTLYNSGDNDVKGSDIVDPNEGYYWAD